MTSLLKRIVVVLMFGLPFVFVNPGATAAAQTQPTKSATKKLQRLTVTGKLERAMGIGGETSGWMITPHAQIKVDGEPADTIEVQGDAKTLDSLADQRVVASGVIIHKKGVTRGPWPVLSIKSIRKATSDEKISPASTSLEGTHWKLTDVGDKPAVSDAKTDLLLNANDKRVSATAGCNRMAGSYDLDKDKLHFSQMIATRMACAEPLLQQEQALTQALEATTGCRIREGKLELLKDDQLLARFEPQQK